MVKNKYEPPAHVQFSYSSVVGMLLYLVGHKHPNMAYAVNCCATYMFEPKHLHELALKWIVHYLKSTTKKRLVLNPFSLICKIECISHADFSGMYGHEKPTDPSYVKIRTGYIITFADFPVLWKLKLKNKTTLSTM